MQLSFDTNPHTLRQLQLQVQDEHVGHKFPLLFGCCRYCLRSCLNNGHATWFRDPGFHQTPGPAIAVLLQLDFQLLANLMVNTHAIIPLWIFTLFIYVYILYVRCGAEVIIFYDCTFLWSPFSLNSFVLFSVEIILWLRCVFLFGCRCSKDFKFTFYTNLARRQRFLLVLAVQLFNGSGLSSKLCCQQLEKPTLCLAFPLPFVFIFHQHHLQSVAAIRALSRYIISTGIYLPKPNRTRKWKWKWNWNRKRMRTKSEQFTFRFLVARQIIDVVSISLFCPYLLFIAS